MPGVLLNMATVVVGTVIGVFAGRFIPARFRQICFFAIGSCTIAFGVIMVVSGYNELAATGVGSLAAIVLVVSMVLGALTGELLRIEERLEGLGKLIKRLVPLRKGANAEASAGAGTDSSPNAGAGFVTAASADVGATPTAAAAAAAPATPTEDSTFAEGFMTASIFFCAGAMTIMGSIQAGLGDSSTLFLKSTLDGVSSLALSTALGVGVGFSVVTIGVVQGGIALGASALAPFISPAIMAAINLTGGAMLLALGIDILGIKKLKVGNLLPALVYAVILAILLQ